MSSVTDCCQGSWQRHERALHEEQHAAPVRKKIVHVESPQQIGSILLPLAEHVHPASCAPRKQRY